MKTNVLLLILPFLLSSGLHAQVPQFHALKSRGSVQTEKLFNPKCPVVGDAERFGPTGERVGFPPMHPEARLIIPAKRTMFDSSGYLWKWDTILCYKTSGPAPDYRVTRKYSLAGDSFVQLTERSQSGTGYVKFARESFTFDSAGNWLTYLSEKWENNAWVNQSKKQFVYNSNGDMVDWKEAWWQNNFWVNDWHYYNHFDANGLNDTSMQQIGQDSLWVNFSLYIQSYDTNGYRVNAVGSSWVKNGWSVINLDSFTNNANGKLFTFLRQLWENSSWVNNSLSTMTYDTVGNKLSGMNQQWQNNAWENNTLTTYGYDGNGNKIFFMMQGWSGSSWINENRGFISYDTSNNILSQTSQSWDNTSWKNVDTEQYTYDTWGNSLTGKYFWWYQNTWQPYDGSLMVYADHQRDDYINLIELYRYDTVLDSIMVFTEPCLTQGQITLFPNPAHSMVYVRVPVTSSTSPGSLTLYDLRGQLVLTKPVINETTGIDVSGLNPGLYFVRFNDNRVTVVLKFVKD